MTTLTQAQQDIVELDQGEHLILAPPGTGKTEILSERIVYAVEQGVSQKTMGCFTFTNRAAANMSLRIKKKLGEHDVFVGNIHSWCSEFIYKHNLVPKNSSLLDEEDSLLIVGDLMEEHMKEFELTEFEKKWNRGNVLQLNASIRQKEKGLGEELMVLPKEMNFSILNKMLSVLRNMLGIDSIDKEYQLLLNICSSYEQVKKESLYFDFDNLLLICYFYLKHNAPPNPIFNWIQIDEVQDLNPLQWAIIDLIANKEQSHRVFFGDYEQAIFSFMGAKRDSLEKLQKEGINLHHLVDNFRSPQYLLDLYNDYANAWTKPTWKTKPKSQLQVPPNGRNLLLTKVDGFPNDERDYVASELDTSQQTAILVRTNNAADAYANALDKKKLKYFKVSGFDLFRRKEVKDLMAFFHILIKDKDRKSWSRVFWKFAGIKTLKESRILINKMFSVGLNPIDFVKDSSHHSVLEQLNSIIYSGRIVVFDTETTGLDTESNDIIQIAATEIINGEIGEMFEVYIDTEQDLRESQKIHGISQEYLKTNGIDRIKALNDFIRFANGCPLIAHNVKFDKAILLANLQRSGIANDLKNSLWFDSIEIASRLYLNLSSYKLEYLIEHLGIEGTNSHNALDDVKATANLILKLNQKISQTSEARKLFINNHLKEFKKFKESFTPLYEAIIGKFSEQLPLEEVIAMVLGEMEKISPITEDVYEELEKLKLHVEKYCELDEVLSSIKQYIPEYMKYTEVDLVLSDEKIFIGTIHKAKGLEFDKVFIPEVVDGVYPNFYSKREGKEDEDARLLYVAMTRAKRDLHLTYHTKFGRVFRHLSYFVENSIKQHFVLASPREAIGTHEKRPAEKKKIDISQYIGSMTGTYGATTQEMDEYISKERNSWD